MPRPRKIIPTYSHHKPTGQAVVKITGPDGKRRSVYLGTYGSPESQQEYQRLLVGLPTATPTAASPVLEPSADVTVNEALIAYVRHVQAYYPSGDSARGHLDAIRYVRKLAGLLPLREFTPKVLKLVRQQMIDAGHSRVTINCRCQRITLFMKWCVAEELCGPDVLAALKAVPGLRKGRCEAKELPPTRPPTAEDLAKVIAKLPPVAAALSRVQSLCGARAGELIQLRADQLDRSGDVWTARVAHHKGTWRGKERTLYFGPQAREVLTPLVVKAGGGPLFINGRGRPYHRVQGYRQAIRRACRRAGVAEFGSHALRKFAATRIRATCDVEVARAVLGHADLSLTAAVYAEMDRAKVTEAIGRVG
jgi:integrase